MTDFTDSSTKTFGLVLGGGGVKGLAHIALLKQLDHIGIKPSRIAGTSMGAIIGALYAAGLSGEDIEKRVRDHTVSKHGGLKETLKKSKQLFRWVQIFSFEKKRGGLVNAAGLFEHLFSELMDLDFAELEIPFSAAATHYLDGVEVVLDKGPLLPAVKASMAVPGIFAPVRLDRGLLVDGGLTNNLPCSHIKQDLDLVIASDVITLPKDQEPSSTQAMSGAVDILLVAATQQQLKEHPADFIFQPNTAGIDVFDFHKINDILERGEEEAEPRINELKTLLTT